MAVACLFYLSLRTRPLDWHPASRCERSKSLIDPTDARAMGFVEHVSSTSGLVEDAASDKIPLTDKKRQRVVKLHGL